ANASWLVCSEICIPGEAKLALDLPIATAPPAADPSAAALFAAVRDRVPQAAKFTTRFAASGRELRLIVPAAALAGLDRPTAAFFPFDGNVVDAAAEPKEEKTGGGLALVLARTSGLTATLPERLSGVLALRAGGDVVGWGFQLQSPVVVGLLAYLLFAMGLSLSGVAEFGAALAGTGSRFADGAGLPGAFATGILATIVATPCTAPFMGAALGFALLAPAPLALAIFVALGIGLAAPLAIATLIPGFARLLPRPGRWMVLLKQLLAFRLYGTVAWLVWVLIQEVGPEGA